MQHFLRCWASYSIKGPAVREASFQISGAWFGQVQLSLRVS